MELNLPLMCTEAHLLFSESLLEKLKQLYVICLIFVSTFKDFNQC